MSATAPTDPTVASTGGSKKNKKKKGKGKNTPKAVQTDNAEGGQDHEDNTDEPGTPIHPDTPTDAAMPAKHEEVKQAANGVVENPSSNGYAAAGAGAGNDADAVDKLEAMSKEREALRSEVQELRRQLESIQESHATEKAQLQTELEESNGAKETAEEKYHTLLDRVEKIKESLGDRLRRDRQELEEANKRIEELETENEQLRGDDESGKQDVARLRDELQDATRELTSLRSRNNLSAQNWLREKDEFGRLVQHLKEEVETTTNAMSEWEVIAMEERSVKESLAEKLSDMEEELLNLRENYRAAAAERDEQSAAADNLQRALREIQEARKKELRDLVETSQEESKVLKETIAKANTVAVEAESAKEALSKELERMAPFEKEVKEKNLLIGKLRHEAIVLNDHLTKALRYLKKTKPEDNVDRQIVTNHLLHFLTLDRSDPKRFQILQVMAGYLAWTDEQREQAGLARPGASGSSLRLPASPFHRTPSTPSLSTEFFSDPGSASGKESLADLWASFLERSAEEGSEAGKTRKDSVSSAATSKN